jgi:energy-coupling factor transporter ATP-binding protein EcfA2
MGLQTYHVVLRSKPSRSFHCQRAANSLDIDTAEKLTHDLKIEADVTSPYKLGLVVGASGSGKTTLSEEIWGKFKPDVLNPKKPVIDQFPEDWDYDARAEALCGVGLTQVVCWIRPAHTLSNGQKSRAEIALRLASVTPGETVTIDEWTSVVDRTVAKVMSHCVRKFAQCNETQIVLNSCHYDVIDWLDPDWIIDCNKATFHDRRSLQPDKRKRKEKLEFGIREVGRETWPYFSKYHYLSAKLPGGLITMYGLFLGAEQVGFICFANYNARRTPRSRIMMHANRLVVHPDYAGMGLGILFITETAKHMHARGYDVRAKFSSTPVFRALNKHKNWVLQTVARPTKLSIGGSLRRGNGGGGKTFGFRLDVKVFSFRYVPQMR